jgi:hypothetical protein
MPEEGDAAMDIDETTERVQPGPLRWIRYVYGAGLPERYRTWCCTM